MEVQMAAAIAISAVVHLIRVEGGVDGLRCAGHIGKEGVPVLLADVHQLAHMVLIGHDAAAGVALLLEEDQRADAQLADGTIEGLIAEHREDPGQRKLQKVLAREVTVMCHGQQEYDNAVAASRMLFGNATSEELRKLDERTFLAVFSGVPTFNVPKAELPCNLLDLLAVKTQVFPSKGEARKMVQGGGVSLNKDKVADISYEVSEKDILDGKYILVQRGKKNYYILSIS